MNNKKNIPMPTEQGVNNYLEKWEKLEGYVAQENALNKLFLSLCPRNRDIDDVLIKAGVLNSFYSTRATKDEIYKIARHIVDLNSAHCCDIDTRLMCGDLALVSDIASATKKSNNGRGCYSFATKYCSFHNPNVFPIYDSNVANCLTYFRDSYHFDQFENEDLINYPKFKKTLLNFASYYKLTHFSLKQIDHYLWQLGKEYFSKCHRRSIIDLNRR